MPDYSFVVSPSFNPFSMQEMLVPLSAYKDAFEKSEEQYDTLSQGADKFKYLSETLPEGSKARQIYEGYANDLRAQAEDLAHNGLTMGNRRALTSLKRRYQGEMGRILQADEAMREEKKLRQSLGAQDTSLLYANDNLNIDDFLDGKNPNLYRISGNELYTRGAAAGKAASSRIFSAGDAGSTLNGYYRDYVQKLGYSPETIRKFYEDMSTIPELQMAADAILEERGVNQNLSGYNLRRARQSVINGMIDGAVYQENHSPQRDLGVLTPMEQNQITMQQKQFNLSKSQLDARAASMGYRIDDNGNLQIDPDRMEALKELKKSNKGTGSSNTNSGYDTKNKKSIQLTWHGNNPKDRNGEADDDVTIKELEDGASLPGNPVKFDELPSFVKDKVQRAIGGSNTDFYRYYYKPFKQGAWGGIWDDTETEVAIIPTDVVKYNSDPEIPADLTNPQQNKGQ
jgi:hypothetical protein